MPKFLLIDPSIADFAGHHYEYALRVLRAAADRALDPVLATHRNFRGTERLPWPVFATYRYGFFEPRFPRWLKTAHRLVASMLGGAGRDELAFDPPSLPRSVPPSLRLSVSAYLFRRKSRAFAVDSARLFNQVPLCSGDHVFLPTMAEADLLGLLGLFRSNRDATYATWHLLFRRDLDARRDAHDPAQVFRRFQSQLSGQRVYFYTDTDPLTAQYNRLGVAAFQTLPVPTWSAAIHPHFPSSRSGLSSASHESPIGPHQPEAQVLTLRFRPHRACLTQRPLDDLSEAHGTPRSAFPTEDGLRHVVYLGDARTEKGYHWLPRLVSEAAAAGLPVRFTFQSHYNVPGGEPAATAARKQLGSLPPNCRVKLLTEPLTSEAYRQLLLGADIVVIPYDAEAYSARSSGVFAEALSAGKPVIVPAGTWMAGELSRVVGRPSQAVSYHDGLGRPPQDDSPNPAQDTDRAAGLIGAVYSDPENLSLHLAETLRDYDRYQAAAADFSSVWSAACSPDALLAQLVGPFSLPQRTMVR